jgi:hypothetical protein
MGTSNTEPSGLLSRQVSTDPDTSFGRPWRRSVQTLITLVVGEEAGDRRNPRRNHMLRRIVRGDDSSAHAQSGCRPVPGAAAAHDEALAEIQGGPIQQGDDAGRGLPYLR